MIVACMMIKAGCTPKTWCVVISTNFGSNLAALCLLTDRQCLLFYKSGACSFEFWVPQSWYQFNNNVIVCGDLISYAYMISDIVLDHDKKPID